jgi:S-DNA-T family DNA segregation ATPase FtsK/SpoIIIE
MYLHLGEVGVEGSPAAWDPSSRPHGLIVGETGAGKTHLARQVIEQAAEHGPVWVADGKGGGDFAHSPATELGLGPSETIALLDRAADEVDKRMVVVREAGDRVSREPPMLCVIDELAAVQLRRRGEDAKASRDRKEQLQGALGEIALTGRSARVHLLVLLQRPDADALPGAVRDQLGLRVALGWMSADGYRMVFGLADIQPPRCLDPGHGWVSGHVGHRDGPRPFIVAEHVSQQPGTFKTEGGR